MSRREFNVVALANKLRVLQGAEPTALFLGAKAGALFRSQYFYTLLGRVAGPDFSTLPLQQRFSRSYRVLTANFGADNIARILTNDQLLKELRPELPELCVAELVKQGYFAPVLSTGVYQEFEQAFEQVGMARNRDFGVYWPGKDGNVASIVDDRKRKFGYIKLFGDIYDSRLIFDRLSYLQTYKDLAGYMDDLHRRGNLLLVGLDLTWDEDIIDALFPRSAGSGVWYVNDEVPPPGSRLERYLERCGAELILGLEGSYEQFMSALCGQLIGVTPQTARPYEILKPSTPPSQVPERAIQTVQVPRKLQADVQVCYSQVPAGVLAYYTAETIPLVRCVVTNHADHEIKVVVRSEIRLFSFQRTDSVDVPAHQSRTVSQLPLLNPEKVGELKTYMRVAINVLVTYIEDGTEKILLPQDFDVYMWPRNVIRWAAPDVVKGHGRIGLLQYVAAWVTPRKESVEKMLRSASDYLPTGSNGFRGYPQEFDASVPRVQAQAIFLALKEVGKIRYSGSPFAVRSEEDAVVQTIRLPDQSLAVQLANCIDGAVLYASLLEAADLEPVIVILRQHAFVGWKTRRGGGDYEFVETTVIGERTFEEAFALGMKQYRLLSTRGWLKRNAFDPAGFAQLLDIYALHQSGIYPME